MGKIKYKGKEMNTVVIEYYDRQKEEILIGTFVQLNDLPIAKDQLFISPATDKDYNLVLNKTDKRRFAGCCEGREKCKGYLLPIALTCRRADENHVTTNEKYGAYRKDLCYIELDSLEDFETIPE